jgi:hypothetical protein
MGQELLKTLKTFQNLYLLPHSDKKDSKREKEEAITDVLDEVGCD